MTSTYSIVQYVPDPIADERINVGAIVVSGDKVWSKFTQNWSRAKHFGGRQTEFLENFAETFERVSGDELLITERDGQKHFNEEVLKRIAGSWVNSIQLTSPRASTQSPNELLDLVCKKFLHAEDLAQHVVPVAHLAHAPSVRTRSQAARITQSIVKKALSRRLGSKAKGLLKKKFTIPGELDTHQFDVSVVNGTAYLAAHALSFEVPGTRLDNDIKIAAWAMDDVRNADSDLPLAVLALPPKDQDDSYSHAREIFKGLKAEFLTEKEFEPWAERHVADISIR